MPSCRWPLAYSWRRVEEDAGVARELTQRSARGVANSEGGEANTLSSTKDIESR